MGDIRWKELLKFIISADFSVRPRSRLFDDEEVSGGIFPTYCFCEIEAADWLIVDEP